jgi:acyl carrier protein
MSISGITQTTEETELARLIVETLNLDMAAESIDPETPIYGEGLGLDSIDMLEIALVVSQRYGVKLRADDENNVQIFKSLRSLSRFIRERQGA